MPALQDATAAGSLDVNDAMVDLPRQVAQAVVGVYDFSKFDTIVDVGGGHGTLRRGSRRGQPGLVIRPDFERGVHEGTASR